MSDDQLGAGPEAGVPGAQAGEDDLQDSGTDYRQVANQKGRFPAVGHGLVFNSKEGETITGAFRARLSWDDLESPENIVIHLGAFLVGENSKVPVGNPYYSVHHDNDRSKDGSTERSGRRRHGSKPSEEILTVNVGWINRDVARVVLIAYIQDANPLTHTFGDLVNGKVVFSHRIEPMDPSANTEEFGDFGTDAGAHVLDSDYYEGLTVVVMGELHRRAKDETDPLNKVWTYRNIGRGYADLVDVGEMYGVTFIAG